jgi:predicted RNase H-like HicB family nuclease
MTVKLSIVCSQQNNGSYAAVCPDLKGCFTQGDTYEQTILQLKDLIETIIKEDLTEDELQGLIETKAKIFTEYELVV